MFKFKTPRKTKGMTEDQFLKSVFYRNRKELIAKFGHKGALARFKKNIEAQKVIYKTDVKGALEKLANSESFTPTRERLVDNLRKALREYDKVKEFQNLTRDKGKFTKFDESKLRWSDEDHMYIYDNRVFVKFDNSPQDLILGTL